MSRLAEQLFEGLKEAGSDIKAELSRLGTQGANELASALFNGNAFVQYGAGQQPAEQGQEQGHGQEQPEAERQNDNGMER